MMLTLLNPRAQAPISSRLNAIDLYLVVCIFLVFGALMEYAVILFLLKKKRKPFRTIDQGLKHLFTNNKANNGEAAQPLRSPEHRESRQFQVNALILKPVDSFVFLVSGPWS